MIISFTVSLPSICKFEKNVTKAMGIGISITLQELRL